MVRFSLGVIRKGQDKFGCRDRGHAGGWCDRERLGWDEGTWSAVVTPKRTSSKKMISKVGGLRWNFLLCKLQTRQICTEKRAPANRFYYTDTVSVKRDLLWPQRKKKQVNTIVAKTARDFWWFSLSFHWLHNMIKEISVTILAPSKVFGGSYSELKSTLLTVACSSF